MDEGRIQLSASNVVGGRRPPARSRLNLRSPPSRLKTGPMGTADALAATRPAPTNLRRKEIP